MNVAYKCAVGLHELLGHGTGKLFSKADDGTFNFDVAKVMHPFTNQPITTYYLPGETYSTRFADIASAYEECRAECVGIFLCVKPEVLQIFGFEGEEAANITYVNWLSMCREGLLALEYYNPEKNTWSQAHMQARYCILHTLYEASQGNDFITLVKSAEGPILNLNRDKILTIGIPAIAKLLRDMTVLKSIGDIDMASQVFKHATTVPPELLEFRSSIMSRKAQRRVFVQSRTRIAENDTVQLVEYEASHIGLVQYFVDRFAA